MNKIMDFISTDMLISLILSFLVATIIGSPIIKGLYNLKFGQNIRQDGPQSHLKKAGTPTIGGIIFITSTTIVTFIMIRDIKDEAFVALFAFIAFGFIGFLDDIIKIVKRNNLGLRAYQKMILLLIVSGVLSYYSYVELGTKINVPFINTQWDLGVLYIPFVIFYFAATTNAVNLTDGLDGLATSVTILVMTFLSIVSFNLGNYTLTIFYSFSRVTTWLLKI